MLKYYPLTRIRQNLYTRGNEFQLPDGTFYTGRYYLTYTGDAYKGINPILGTNEVLKRFTPITQVNNTKRTYAQASPSQQTDPSEDNLTLTTLTPYFPFPLESDYARGYFSRYFAKSVSGPGYVIEISKLDWTKIQDGNVSPTVLGYQTTEILWQLTGPLNDTRVSQYQIKGGVFTTNKRVTENKAKGFNGLVAFIGGEYTKFARITPNVATTGSI